jgi:hypothetical protein
MTTPTTGPSSQTPPSGQQPSGALSQNIQSDVQSALGDITEAALKENNFDNLVGYLSKADRNRIGQVSNENFQDLNNIIAQIQQDWKNKYNQSLDLSQDTSTLYNQSFAQITPGMAAGEAQPAGAQIPANQQQGGASNTDQNHVTVKIPASHNLSATTLHLVNEGTLMNSWKLDIPDNVDGMTLKNSLVQHLQQVRQSESNWPSDPTEARRIVAHHILMALASPSAGSGSTATPSQTPSGQ